MPMVRTRVPGNMDLWSERWVPDNVGGGIMSLEKYPWLFPPPGFQPLNRAGLKTITGVAGDVVGLETIKLAIGYTGWVTRMGLESGDWNSVGFQFTVGGQPLRDFTLIQVPIGSPSTPENVYINIPPNVTVNLQVLLLGPVAPTPVRWYLGGWFYQ